MFNLKSMTLDAIIRTVYSDDGRLRPEQLAELAGPEVSNYDLLSLLCTYLNGLKKDNMK